MKTVKQIEIGKCFTLAQDRTIASFVRVEENKHDGCNAHCLLSTNPTYDKSTDYFIQLDLEVIPTI